MEKLKNLVGQRIEEKFENYSHQLLIDKVSIGGRILENRIGIIVINNGEIKGNAILSSDYVLLTHSELKEKFLNELRTVYDGKVEIKEITSPNGMQYRLNVLLKDIIRKVEDIPYEIRKSTNLFDQKLVGANGDISPILSLTNSYDGSKKVVLTFGLYRYFCLNILTRAFSSRNTIRYSHIGDSLFKIEFNMPLIMNVMNIILDNIETLVKIKVNGNEMIKRIAEYIDSQIVEKYLETYRAEMFKDPNLWEIINEITYLTSHKIKIKLRGRKRLLLSSGQANKLNNLVYDLLEEYLNPMYQELKELLGEENEEANIEEAALILA